MQQQEQLFELWYQVRDGTLARPQFIDAVAPIRQQVKELLEEESTYPIGAKEKTPLAKTARTCQQLLTVKPALWLVVTTVGVEPTNHVAEQAIRPAVLWRHCSYGSQREAGSLFVGRMMIVGQHCNGKIAMASTISPMLVMPSVGACLRLLYFRFQNSINPPDCLSNPVYGHYL